MIKKTLWLLSLPAFLGCGTVDNLPSAKSESFKAFKPREIRVSQIAAVETLAPAVETAAIEVVPAEPVVTEALNLPGHENFARSVFDDHSDIAPWRANYVGSYGVLPTRFQDKGPFLYSFDRKVDFEESDDGDDRRPRGHRR